MQNFIFKLRSFMEGRNGVDKLSIGIVVLYSILAFIKIFLRFSNVAYVIVSVLQFALLAYAVFRILSKNLQKRYNETET